MKKEFLFVLAVGLVILGSAGITNATIINYTATDLTDTGIGDLWEYSYTVSDNTFAADTGFTIWFDYGLYDNITPETNSADWDVVSWDPDLIFGIADDGAYDALALMDGAFLVETFTVSFNWLGGPNEPSAQSYEIYDSSFSVIESGTTTASAPVPEPSTILLMGIGFVGLVGSIYREKRKK